MSRKPIEVNQGDKYNRLTIIREVEPHVKPSGKKQRKFLAKCECGVEKEYLLSNLRKTNHTTSCGCYNEEKVKERRTTHGLCEHPLYKVLQKTKERCLNPSNKSFKYYGARGITICKEWRESAENFINWALDSGYEKGLQIDRIDNDKGYSPDNCRFVNRSINCLNRRITGAIEYRGVSFNKSSNKYRADVTINGKRNI